MSKKGGDVLPPAKVASSYARLKQAAEHLNKVSDLLARVITDVEYLFKRLNLGIPAWVTIVRHDYHNSTGDFWSRELGYAKVGPKWCVAVRLVEGDGGDPNEWRIEEYPFNESPRRFRVEAVSKLPELLDTLSELADRTAADLKQETKYAEEFVAAIRGPHGESKARAGRGERDNNLPDAMAKHEAKGLVPPPDVPAGLSEVVRKMHIGGLDKTLTSAAESLRVPLPELPRGLAESLANLHTVEMPKGMADMLANLPAVELPKGLAETLANLPRPELSPGLAEALANLPQPEFPTGLAELAEALRTTAEVEVDALAARTAQPAPPTSAKEADARALKRLKELAQRQGAADALKKR